MYVGMWVSLPGLACVVNSDILKREKIEVEKTQKENTITNT